jgi:hypothetical protein
VGPGIAESETAGVGENGDIQRPGHLAGYRPSVRLGNLENELPGCCGARIDVPRAGRQDAGAHMVIDAGHGYPALAHGLDQHAEPGEVGDIENDDDIGSAQLLHRFRGTVHAGQILKEKAEAGWSGAGVGDDCVDPLPPKKVDQPDLAAEAVTIRVDVRGQADPLPGLQCGCKALTQLGLFRGQRQRHFQY